MYSDHVFVVPEDNDLLMDMLYKCAARYYPEQADQLVLMRQTVTSLAHDPRVMTVMPMYRAVFITMLELVLADRASAKAKGKREGTHEITAGAIH